MDNGNDLSSATERLSTALKAMEDAVASKRHADLTVESLEEQVQSLEASLDAERQRGEKLAAANEDVSERLDTIMDTIKDMLQSE